MGDDNIKIDLKEIGVYTRNHVDSVQGRNYWKSLRGHSCITSHVRGAKGVDEV